MYDHESKAGCDRRCRSRNSNCRRLITSSGVILTILALSHGSSLLRFLHDLVNPLRTKPVLVAEVTQARLVVRLVLGEDSVVSFVVPGFPFAPIHNPASFPIGTNPS